MEWPLDRICMLPVEIADAEVTNPEKQFTYSKETIAQLIKLLDGYHDFELRFDWEHAGTFIMKGDSAKHIVPMSFITRRGLDWSKLTLKPLASGTDSPIQKDGLESA